MPEDVIERLERRLSKIEEWRSKQDISIAVTSHTYSVIENRLDKIDGHITKLVWLLLTGLLVPAIGFVINGGIK